MNDDLKQLALLDPARGREPGEAQWARSRARLDEIVATREAVAPARPRLLRLAAGLAAAGVLAAGAIVAWPSLMPSASSTAYASWTSVPQPLPEADLRARADVCAETMDLPWEAGPPKTIVLGERRGQTALLIMTLADGTPLECLMFTPDKLDSGQTLNDEPGVAVPRGTQVTMRADRSASQMEDDSWVSVITGRAGEGVTGIDVLVPGRADPISASLAGGWWAVWWPGEEASGAASFSLVVHSAEGDRRLTEKNGERGVLTAG